MALHRFLKRKGEVNDDFPLCSPATKIRRLDAELPPIVEEDEPLPSPSPSPNDERALVLFKPVAHSPSTFSFTVDSDLINGITNNQYLVSKLGDGFVTGLQSRDKVNDELALVPWVPSPSYQSSSVHDIDDSNTELMEADEMEEGVGSMMMDIEQEGDTGIDPKTFTSNIHYPTTHSGITEGFQQHCLFPHLPHNTSTPITWTR
ncbi:hypothetical protein PHAVU_002G303500 [Phaseolus vulgaris]|uniref:Uncharacterized protein n=1 Tax=Phaseolus vulgaris TaxID=3885 RepID=V7CPV0_PHAVU|nr:hypothetical protein PHAVU_002G303500g [Phaseolus vulgaris]ESW32222.1 hypothetical protein PHAVU_002G303500g [Phaseolus vulgaris]